MKNEKRYKTEILKVTGMSCASCAISAETILNAQDGVSEARVNFVDSSVRITYDKERILIDDLKHALNAVGYDLYISKEQEHSDVAIEQEHKKFKTKLILIWAFTLPAMIIGMFFNQILYFKIIMLTLSIPVLFIFGNTFFIRAYKHLKHGSVNMDTLVALSASVSFLYSLSATFFPDFWESKGITSHVYYEAAVAIIAFVFTGKYLEEKAKAKTFNSVRKLAELQSKFVLKITDSGIKEIPLAEVRYNDLLVVRPGEKVPVDGIITEGHSFIDESLLSGEPVPVEKQTGNKVFAGTINQKGNLTLKAEKVGAETYLAKIIELVKNAQGSKAPVQNLADKIASVFVPVIIGISVITFFTWWLSGSENALAHALLTSITVLVVACPCALGLAIPTAIVAGIGKSAEYNILIKDAESLQNLRKTDFIVFDKTGTITEGKPTVSNIEWLDESDIPFYQSVLFEMEKKSGHPLSSAIVKHFEKEETKKIRLNDFESIPARGLKAHYNSSIFFTGNKALLDENNINQDELIHHKVNVFEKEGKTVVLFANQKHILAIIALTDTIKPEAVNVIQKLNTMGIETLMLTGDSKKTAGIIANRAGIQNFKAGLSPIEKADIIQELQKKHFVCMIGDGINDSFALTKANVGIAIGNGSDIAIESANIIITGSELKSILYALKISKNTFSVLKQNLFWAFIYNLIGIPIAAGVLYFVNGFLLNPMIAAAAMSLSSVSVVINSLKLKYKRYKNTDF